MAMVVSFRVAIAATGLCQLLAGCMAGGTNPEVPPPGSEPFQLGYLHGCPSGYTDAQRVGYEAGHYVKDETLYRTKPDYRKGWEQGHQACFEEERRHPKMGGAEGGIDLP